MIQKRWRGLPLQLLALSIFPLIILLVVTSVAGLVLHQRSMRTLVGDRDERAARAAAAAISEQLNHRAAAVRSLALRAADDADPSQALADAAFLHSDFDGGLALFDSRAGLVAADTDSSLWQSPAVVRLLEDLDLSRSPQFLPIFTDDETGEFVMLVVGAAGDGSFAAGAFYPGAMVQRVLASVFGARLQSAAFVLDADGHLLSQIGSASRLGPDLSSHPGVVGAIRGESGTNYLSVDRSEIVVAFSPVAPVGWALVLEEPWQAVADPLLRVTEVAPLLLVPLLLVALVGLWFGVRQIVQPLQALSQKATRLAWGDFAAIEEPAGGIDEIQRLQAELVHMAGKVQAAQQGLRSYLGAVTTGQEEERRRLARELHDDTIQSLIALNQRLQLAQMDGRPGIDGEKLVEMEQMINQIITDLRRLTRALRPIYLEDLGLSPALSMLARDTSALLGIPVEYHTTGGEQRLRPEVELTLYRMAQEALSNVARHADADGVEVHLAFAADEVALTVADDGQGFEVPESPAELAPQGHFGLLGLQERAELIGGKLTVWSAPGQGSRLQVTVPAEKQVDEDA